MNLHTADKADWEDVSPDKYNIWQRMAASTDGVVTPANFVSVVGAAVTVYGVYKLSVGSTLYGGALIIAGRLADILDGAVAELTGTKSPLGEAVDATIDKLLLAVAVVALLAYELVPFPVWLLLFLHGTYNACLLGVTIYRKRRLHPIKMGKYGTAFEWATIVGFVFHHYIESTSTVLLANIIFIIASVCCIAFAALSAYSSYIYSIDLKHKGAV